jgi:serine/threonine protein kinase
MVCNDGTVKVLDFGLAKWTDLPDGAQRSRAMPTSKLTAEGYIVGTPRFMSPEQLGGEEVTARSDQFSWALVAYELLSGKQPWSTVDPAVARNLVEAIHRAYPKPLSEVAPWVPAGIQGIVWRALAKEPDRRFPSMATIAAALMDEQASIPTADALPFAETERPGLQAPSGGDPAPATAPTAAARPGAAPARPAAPALPPSTVASPAVERARAPARGTAVIVGVVIALSALAAAVVFLGPWSPFLSYPSPSSTGSTPASTPIAPTTSTVAHWDGTTNYVCGENEIVSLSGVTANLKSGIAVEAWGNCKLTMTDMNLTAANAVLAIGQARVTIRGGTLTGSTAAISTAQDAQVSVTGGTLNGSTAAIMAGGNSRVSLSGTSVNGKVIRSDNGRVDGAPIPRPTGR